VFGFLGLATAAELQDAMVCVNWGNDTNPDTAVLAKPLHVLVAQRALPAS
jgi:hypothetical protein